MKNGVNITVREFHEILDNRTKEILATVNRLEERFNILEAGRLSALETKFADLKGNLQGRFTVIATIISTFVGFAFLIVQHWLSK